ncbi:MAG: TlpA disulfide reductase family protein [Pirellulales bacterium]
MSYDAESPAEASGPRPQRIFWVVLAVLAAAVFVQLVLRPRGPGVGEARRHPAVGSKLVGLHVVPLTGEGDDVYLSSLEGDVTMLNFWGTWCPPCRQEFPHVAALYDHFADRDDFRLLAVSYPGGSTFDLAALRLRHRVVSAFATGDAAYVRRPATVVDRGG